MKPHFQREKLKYFGANVVQTTNKIFSAKNKQQNHYTFLPAIAIILI